uniref:Scavenger receptor class B member 1 n=1 Tax=Aceria tosichella TaxID=561515 RepID=A0A6G1SIR4_9ACAR
MCRLFLVTCACLAILFGGLSLYMMPKLIQQKIEQRMQLKIGTKTFDRFTRVPIPITVKFYLFNITNADQVLAGLERPQFDEVGPFIYKQWRRRDVVDIIDNNRKIVYREYKTFYSSWPSHLANSNDNNNNDHASSWQLEDGTLILNPKAYNVTMINLPLLSVLNQLGQLEEGTLKRSAASRIVARLIQEANERILITRPVNELLFDGYKVGLMDAASDLISNTLGYNFESPLPRNKFGFFHGKNGTWSRKESGEMTIFTGRNESMKDFMLVDNWNGQKQLNVWPKNTEAGNRCNEIRGTDGSQFHPGVTREQTLDIFSPLICSSIFVKYKEDTSVRDIPLLRFTTPPDVFAAPRKSPRNACYCTIAQSTDHHHHQQAAMKSHHRHHRSSSSTSLLHNSNGNISQPGPSSLAVTATKHKARITDSRCYIDGLMDLSLCQKGAPIAASSPHFYNADPMLAMAADMKPQKERHETYLDIEPMTGAVFRAASRAQLNALVEQAALQVVDPQLIGNMTAMVTPLLWIEETAEIDEKSSLEFKGQLLNTVNKARRTFIYAIVIGCILFIGVAIQYWYVTCYKIDTSSKPKKRRDFKNNRRKFGANDDDDDDSVRGGDTATPSGPRAQRRPPGSRRDENLAMAQTKLIGMDSDKPASSSTSGPGAGALVAAAAAMGAADAAVTANQRRRDRRRPHRRADYEDDDEDELSKRGLVENEWAVGGGSADRSTTENSSPVASTSGGDQADSPLPQPPSSDKGDSL